MEDSPSDVGALESFFGRLKARQDELVAGWRDWAAGQPQAITCERHGAMLAIHEEDSLRASFRAREDRVVYARCAECEAEARLAARSEALRAAGVRDENVLHASLDNFACRSDEDRANLEAARRFAGRPRGFLVMLGPVGTGKTHLAVAVMRAAEVRARFVTQGALLRRLRATYGDKHAEDPVRAFSAVRLMVLDEAGISGGGRDELPMLHEILSARHEARKATVITSNCASQDELAQVIGDRMADRLRQSGVSLLMFRGESMRPRYRREYHEQ